MREQETVGVVFEPFQEMWRGLLHYLPSLAAGLLILLLGMVVCWLVKRVVIRLFILLRIDRPLRQFSWARALEQADVRHALANTLGDVASGFVFLVFLSNALTVWRLEILSRLIGELVDFVPRLIVSALVLISGSVVAAIASSRVRTGLALEGFSRAGLAARLLRWGLMTIVVALTLEELGLGPKTLQSTVKIGLGSLGLTLVLAFGLGSRQAVSRLWESLREKPAHDVGEE